MRIAIVGNGSSLLKLRKGQEIDDHDIVIRMNLYYRLIDKDITGVKTDVWSCCFDVNDKNHPNTTAKIWCARPLDWKAGNWHIQDTFRNRIDEEMYDYEEARCMIRANKGLSPTTGFNTLWMANRIYKDAEKDLYGYDFYEPNLFYYHPQHEVDFHVTQHHSPSVEKEIIKNWEKEGKCRLIYQ